MTPCEPNLLFQHLFAVPARQGGLGLNILSKQTDQEHLSSLLVTSILQDHIISQDEANGLQVSSGKTVGGMLFADDFVGISDSKESLQKLIDVVYI